MDARHGGCIMSALRRLYVLDEGQVVARIDKHNLPDLDDLALEVLDAAIDEGAWWLEDVEWDDAPTRITSGSEPVIRHRRISPCSCGDHSWHMDWVSEDENGMPNGTDARGSFLAVEWD